VAFWNLGLGSLIKRPLLIVTSRAGPDICQVCGRGSIQPFVDAYLFLLSPDLDQHVRIRRHCTSIRNGIWAAFQRFDIVLERDVSQEEFDLIGCEEASRTDMPTMSEREEGKGGVDCVSASCLPILALLLLTIFSYGTKEAKGYKAIWLVVNVRIVMNR
jgi:hypothetical protein